MPSLYEHAHGKWQGGIMKHRYKVARVGLDDVAHVSRLLAGVERAVLLGDPRNYQVG